MIRLNVVTQTQKNKTNQQKVTSKITKNIKKCILLREKFKTESLLSNGSQKIKHINRNNW